jgi:hypothetical protein
MKLNFNRFYICCFLSGLLFTKSGFSQEQQPLTNLELAKKIANPIGELVTVPFKSDFDMGIGNHNGSKTTLYVQPIISKRLSPKLRLITRWILPFVSQYDIIGDGTSQAGLGDAVVTGFLSPSKSKFIWGIGPVFLLPTATNQYLGGKKFGIGPSFVALTQKNGWTIGGLVNHIFSVAGDENRSDINASFINPFVIYNWKSGSGITLNSEYTHDWENDLNILVIMPTFTALAKFGSQAIGCDIGPRIHFAPQKRANYGIRAGIIWVFKD